MSMVCTAHKMQEGELPMPESDPEAEPAPEPEHVRAHAVAPAAVRRFDTASQNSDSSDEESEQDIIRKEQDKLMRADTRRTMRRVTSQDDGGIQKMISEPSETEQEGQALWNTAVVHADTELDKWKTKRMAMCVWLQSWNGLGNEHFEEWQHKRDSSPARFNRLFCWPAGRRRSLPTCASWQRRSGRR